MRCGTTKSLHGKDCPFSDFPMHHFYLLPLSLSPETVSLVHLTFNFITVINHQSWKEERGTQRQPSRSPYPDRLGIISSRPNSTTPKRRVSSGFVRVMGRPAGSTGFCRVIALTGLWTNLNRSSHRVGRFPGRPAGPVRV
jgi:hypothetical protein